MTTQNMAIWQDSGQELYNNKSAWFVIGSHHMGRLKALFILSGEILLYYLCTCILTLAASVNWMTAQFEAWKKSFREICGLFGGGRVYSLSEWKPCDIE